MNAALEFIDFTIFFITENENIFVEKLQPPIKNAAKRTRQHARIVFHQKLSSTEGHLPP